MHASSGESSGASFERASSARSPQRPRWRSQRRMRFSTRAATLAISARVGAGPSRNAGGAVAFRTGEHAIRHQDVKMDEATERRVEALHESHSKRLAAGARSMLLPARYFLHENAALRRQRVRAERAHATNFVRRGQHPLPHRDVGQDVIHQVRRGVAHPPSGARRARSAAFARERDNDFLTALRAHDAQKAVRQDAATHVRRSSSST
jgi:hypothetical protein